MAFCLSISCSRWKRIALRLRAAWSLGSRALVAAACFDSDDFFVFLLFVAGKVELPSLLVMHMR